MKRSIAGLIWLFWWLPLVAWSSSVREVDEAVGRHDVSAAFEYLEDREQRLDFSAVRGGHVEFVPNARETLSFGYVNSAYWLRLTVVSRAPRDTSWLLELAGLARSIDSIDAWLPEHTQGNREPWTFKHFRSGDRVPFSLRSVQHHAILFPLSLPPGEPVTLYLRVSTNGTLQMPAILWSTARYAEVEHHDYLQEGIFYGILLVMIFYNAFIFLSVRDASYLHYVLYLVCVFFFAVSLKGIGFEYLWPEATWWNNKSNLVFAVFGVFFLLLFAISFLQTRKNTPYLHLLFRSLLFTSVVILPLVLFGSHYVAASALSMQYLLSVGAVIVAASLTLKRGFKAARYYLLAWLGVLLAVLMWVLNSFSLINNSWIGAYSFQVGTAIQVILFSFALADRINLLRRERESALKMQLEHSRKLISMADMFEKFVPRQFLSRIARKGIENIELGKAEDDTITVLFADIRGFTPLSEAMNPQQLLNFLNSYFKRMDKVIHHHDGFIDKFLGDGIMAIFEAGNVTQGARNAVLSAIDMHKALVIYNEHRANSGYAPIDIGIGVNTGDVVIGTVGSEERMDSTVLGDNVNIAARLQELTKTFGVKIIVSEHTQISLGGDSGFLLRELGDVNVRGRKESVRLFEVFNADPDPVQQDKLSALPTHRVALECFRRGEWAWAKMLWEDCQNRYPTDPVYRYMLEQCDLHLVSASLNRY
jgi:adenylate cyclase